MGSEFDAVPEHVPDWNRHLLLAREMHDTQAHRLTPHTHPAHSPARPADPQIPLTSFLLCRFQGELWRNPPSQDVIYLGVYVGRARALDHTHSRQADGTPYPGVREQVQRHLVGPVLAALHAWDPVVGLVVGSYQGCSEGLHALAREVAEERARTEWRRMGARSEHEALGIFVHDVHRRWGSVFWRSWARVIRGRLPAIGRPNAEILHHGPPPAYARGQVAVGGAEPWPQVHPGILRGMRAAAGL
jgi:hypothetical protein